MGAPAEHVRPRGGSACLVATREPRFPHPTQSKGRNKSVLPRRARDFGHLAKTGRKTGGKLAPGAVQPAADSGLRRGKMPQGRTSGTNTSDRMYKWHCRIVLHVQGGERGLSARSPAHAKVAWRCCTNCARKLESDNMRVSRTKWHETWGYTSEYGRSFIPGLRIH